MDVTIHAPAALARLSHDAEPTPHQLREENIRLRAELSDVHNVASTLTNIVASLLKMLAEDGENAVTIPRDLSDRMKGAKVHVRGEIDGVVVALQSSGHTALVAIEGGPDGR